MEPGAQRISIALPQLPMAGTGKRRGVVALALLVGALVGVVRGQGEIYSICEGREWRRSPGRECGWLAMVAW